MSDEMFNALSLIGKDNKSITEMRSLIFKLEEVMKQMPGCLYASDFDTKHHFDDGIYMRELFIPKSMVLTGRIHNNGHLNILSKGKITVWTEEGMKTLTSSTIIKSKPGIKRVGYAHEDSIWITVHSNESNEKDLKKVESRLFSDTFEEAYLKSNRTEQDAMTFLGTSKKEAEKRVLCLQ